MPHIRRIPVFFAALAGLLVPRVVGAVPLAVQDPTPREVAFEVEISQAPNAVGQVFGPARNASWTATATTGTLTISAATHEEMRSSPSWTAVPESFGPIVIEVDLATLEATSRPASGAIETGNVGLAFTQNALDTSATLSYVGPDVDSFLCSSQSQVDALCLVAPQFCGQLCIPVAGSAYDPETGLVNLVGSETQTACDGGQCFGPYDFFAKGGDLRLSELPAPEPAALPSLPATGAIALALLLAASGLAARRVERSGRMSPSG